MLYYTHVHKNAPLAAQLPVAYWLSVRRRKRTGRLPLWGNLNGVARCLKQARR